MPMEFIALQSEVIRAIILDDTWMPGLIGVPIPMAALAFMSAIHETGTGLFFALAFGSGFGL